MWFHQSRCLLHRITLSVNRILNRNSDLNRMKQLTRRRRRQRNELHNSYSLRLRGGRPRVRSSSPGEGKNFLFSASSRLDLGLTQPPIQWVQGALSPGVKRSGREAEQSSPTSAEVKKTCIYTSTPPYAFMT
jgi:hypothetical protein